MPADFAKALKRLEDREESLRQQAGSISTELETIRVSKIAIKQAMETAPPPKPRTVTTLVIPGTTRSQKPN